MNYLNLLHQTTPYLLSTPALLFEVAFATDRICRWNVPQNPAITRIVGSMLYANAAVSIITYNRLVEPITRHTWIVANLATLIVLGVLALIKPTQSPKVVIPETITFMRCPKGLNVPKHGDAALEQLKPGVKNVINVSKGWDGAPLAWAITSHEKFKKLRCCYYHGTDVKELQQFLLQAPPCVVLTSFEAKGLTIPPETYVIKLECKEQRAPAFAGMSLEELQELYEGFAKTKEFQQLFTRLKFEEGAIRALCTTIWPDTVECSVYKLLLAMNRIFIEGNLTIRTSEKNRAKLELVEAPAEHIKFNRHVHLPLFYSDEPLVEAPTFLKPLNRSGANIVRVRQADQIVRAVGSPRTPHAAVIDFEAEEMVEVLSAAEGKEVFHLVWTQFGDKGLTELTDFLSYHKGAIIYLSDLNSLLHDKKFLIFFEMIGKAGAYIVGGVKSTSSNNVDFRLNLQMFKLVHLIPLKQAECLAEVTVWAKNYQFEDKALEIAVDAVFLLRGGKGTELSLVKDLLERAVNRDDDRVSIQDVWAVFKTLHFAEEQAHAQKLTFHPELAVNPESIMSLLRISLALKKKYGVILPVEKVELNQPPAFLTDLNEQLKGLETFATDIGGRLDDLNDALTGQYTNALIKGASGSGKTTLIKLAAWLSANDRLPQDHQLYGKTIYALSLSSFVADTKWVGTFESRVTQLFNFLMQNKNAVLFVDEIHLAMGSGATSGNEMGTVGQNFKTYLEESGVMVIGATTVREYERWVRKDGAFVRRFNEITLADPLEKDVLEIFTFYVKTSTYKKLYPELQLTPENIQQVFSIVDQEHSDISVIDRGKKLLEAVAKKARRERRTTVDESFITTVARVM